MSVHFSYALKMIQALYSGDNATTQINLALQKASDSSLTFSLMATLGFLVKVYYP